MIAKTKSAILSGVRAIIFSRRGQAFIFVFMLAIVFFCNKINMTPRFELFRLKSFYSASTRVLGITARNEIIVMNDKFGSLAPNITLEKADGSSESLVKSEKLSAYEGAVSQNGILAYAEINPQTKEKVLTIYDINHRTIVRQSNVADPYGYRKITGILNSGTVVLGTGIYKEGIQYDFESGLFTIDFNENGLVLAKNARYDHYAVIIDAADPSNFVYHRFKKIKVNRDFLNNGSINNLNEFTIQGNLLYEAKIYKFNSEDGTAIDTGERIVTPANLKKYATIHDLNDYGDAVGMGFDDEEEEFPFIYLHKEKKVYLLDCLINPIEVNFFTDGRMMLGSSGALSAYISGFGTAKEPVVLLPNVFHLRRDQFFCPIWLKEKDRCPKSQEDLLAICTGEQST